MSLNSIDVAINGRYLEGLVNLNYVLPGMLLQRYADGVRPLSEAIVTPLVAIENRFTGSNIETRYELGDTVYMRYCLPGDVFWGRTATVYADNVFLISGGNGYLEPMLIYPPEVGTLVGRQIGHYMSPDYSFFAKVEVL